MVGIIVAWRQVRHAYRTALSVFSPPRSTSSGRRSLFAYVSRDRVADHSAEPGGGQTGPSEGFDEIGYRVGDLAPVLRTTCECLSWRGTLDNLERRHTEDAFGETAYHDFPVHSRSAVVIAHELLDRGVTEAELRPRMDAVRARLTRK
jgi:hypothetical protein